MVTMSSISVIVSNLFARRLSILALMLCLGFLSEVTTVKLNVVLVKYLGYGPGVILSMIVILVACGTMAFLVKNNKDKTKTDPQIQRRFASSLLLLSPNFLGTFLFSLGLASLYSQGFSYTSSPVVNNVAIVLGRFISLY